MTSFVVPGTPVSWKRMRLGKGKHFPDPKVTSFKTKVGFYAQQAGAVCHEGAVAMGVRFFWPARNPPRKRNPRPQEPYVTRNCHDLDRLLSAIFDALNGICYVDDGQVVRMLYLEKWRAAQGDPARCEIRVESLG